LVTNNLSEQPSEQRTASPLQRTSHSSSSNSNNTSGLFSHIRDNVQLSSASEPGEVLLEELCSDSGFRSSSGKFLHKLITNITAY